MRVVTVRDFRDHATELLRSEDVVLITRDGRPAGFFLPWSSEELPDDLRREVFLKLTGELGRQLAEHGGTEAEVLADFAAARRRR